MLLAWALHSNRVCTHRVDRLLGLPRIPKATRGETIVKAIETEGQMELLMLLVEGTDFRSVRKWFGEPALTLVVQSAGRTMAVLLKKLLGSLSRTERTSTNQAQNGKPP